MSCPTPEAMHSCLCLLLRACASIATFPAPLDTAFLVCSGSEANDLALRLARTFTRCKDGACSLVELYSQVAVSSLTVCAIVALRFPCRSDMCRRSLSRTHEQLYRS